MVKVFNFEDDTREFSCNTYVIGKIGRDCLIIDPGSTSPKISEYVIDHHDRCLGILLTHGHFDHIRGITVLLKKFNYDIPVYIGREDVQLLTDTTLNESRVHGEEVKITSPVIPVGDEEIINFKKDIHVKVIATPFHTRGSVCYLFGDDNAIFTGDTLFKDSIGRTDLRASEPEMVGSSLKKLTAIDRNLVVYPGHGDITRIDLEKRNNPYLQGL